MWGMLLAGLLLLAVVLFLVLPLNGVRGVGNGGGDPGTLDVLPDPQPALTTAAVPQAAAAAASTSSTPTPPAVCLRVPCPSNKLPPSVRVSRASRKKALILCDNFTGTANELEGCNQDGINVAYALQQLGFTEIEILSDWLPPKQQPTYANILDAFHRLADATKPGDVVYIHDSSHGGTLRDPKDTIDGVDDTLVPLDFERAGQIRDTQMKRELFDRFPAGATVLAVFDCCHSGHIANCKYNYTDATYRSVAPRGWFPGAGGEPITCARDVALAACARQPHSGVNHREGRAAHCAGACVTKAAQAARHAEIGDRIASAAAQFATTQNEWVHKGIAHVKELGPANAVADTAADVYVVSGCRSSQTCADAVIGAMDQGAATYAFLHVLALAGIGATSTADLNLKYLLRNMRAVLSLSGFCQQPQLSTGKLVDLNAVTVRQVLGLV